MIMLLPVKGEGILDNQGEDELRRLQSRNRNNRPGQWAQQWPKTSLAASMALGGFAGTSSQEPEVARARVIPCWATFVPSHHLSSGTAVVQSIPGVRETRCYAELVSHKENPNILKAALRP